jgi:hypothetical protein
VTQPSVPSVPMALAGVLLAALGIALAGPRKLIRRIVR